MIRLLGAEATRLLSRRFTGIALLVLLLGLGAYQLVVNKSLSPLTGEQLATAEQAYQQSHKDWVENHEKYEQDCRDTGGGTAEDCTYLGFNLGSFWPDSRVNTRELVLHSALTVEYTRGRVYRNRRIRRS